VLQIEPVQEMVAWFADCGAQPWTAEVDVLPAPAAEIKAAPVEAKPTAEAAPLQPRMEMHAVPLSRVITTVEEAGGLLVGIHPSRMAPGWVSYLYFIQRRSETQL
jgi:hypothetical protein